MWLHLPLFRVEVLDLQALLFRGLVNLALQVPDVSQPPGDLDPAPVFEFLGLGKSQKRLFLVLELASLLPPLLKVSIRKSFLGNGKERLLLCPYLNITGECRIRAFMLVKRVMNGLLPSGWDTIKRPRKSGEGNVTYILSKIT